MNKVRFIVQSSRSCFRKWKSAPRVLMLFSVIACFIIMYAIPFADNARAQNEPLQCAEIFIALMNWRFTMLLFSTAILLLFGDLPVLEAFTVNTLIKGTRKCFLASQVFYVLLTSLVLTIFIFIISVIVSLPNVQFSNDWSRPVKLLSSNGRIAISPEKMRLGFSKSIVSNYSPWLAFGHCFALFFLMCCFYGFASLTLRMLSSSASYILLIIVNTVSWAINIFPVESTFYAFLSTISIHYHVSLWQHQYTSVNGHLPSLGSSYGFLVSIMIAFSVFSVIFVKHYDYVQMGDDN